MLGRSVSTTADIEQHFLHFIQLAATDFQNVTAPIQSYKWKEFHIASKTKHYYSFSQRYIIFKESLYTISTSVNPPDLR